MVNRSNVVMSKMWKLMNRRPKRLALMPSWRIPLKKSGLSGQHQYSQRGARVKSTFECYKPRILWSSQMGKEGSIYHPVYKTRDDIRRCKFACIPFRSDQDRSHRGKFRGLIDVRELSHHPACGWNPNENLTIVCKSQYKGSRRGGADLHHIYAVYVYCEWRNSVLSMALLPPNPNQKGNKSQSQRRGSADTGAMDTLPKAAVSGPFKSVWLNMQVIKGRNPQVALLGPGIQREGDYLMLRELAGPFLIIAEWEKTHERRRY